MAIAAVLIILAIIIGYLYVQGTSRRKAAKNVPPNIPQLLAAHVAFYNKLQDKDKISFETRVKDFLANTSIRGVETDIDDLDRTLVAAGAIMLIFSFPDWRYNNISEVLVYSDTFTRGFSTNDPERNVLGMVGDGAMHREMILSKKSLRESFQNPSDGENTVAHEFAHLIDKADGATDGVPEYLLPKTQVEPWIKLMHATMRQMMENGRTDINTYGATNDAEFFAVITEYFFERPDKLKEHHPELFNVLDEMFHGERA